MTSPFSIDEWLVKSNELSQALLHQCRTAPGKDYWNENVISAGLLWCLEKIGRDITWKGHAQRTVWESYKLAGKPEQNYGDIAVFVTVWLKEDVSLEGVAFYEAKRQYFDGGKATGFKMLEAKQLSKISKATAASHVLLYDHDGEETGIATAVPTPFIRELLRARDAKGLSTPFAQELHGYGLPWVQRLGNNLRGFDLDFSEDAVRKVKEYVEEDRAPMALLNVATTHVPGMTLELKPFIPANHAYERLDHGDGKDKGLKPENEKGSDGLTMG